MNIYRYTCAVIRLRIFSITSPNRMNFSIDDDRSLPASILLRDHSAYTGGRRACDSR